MDEIDAAFDRLRDFPQIGQLRSDLRTRPLVFPVNHHVIFYPVRSDVIEIALILHEGSNPKLHL
jgi:plasmid stabilization system protein ParE